MKILIFILSLIVYFPTLGQNFKMKMHVREILPDTMILENTNVIWGIDPYRNISFVWDDKLIYLTRKTSNPTGKQRKLIKDIKRKYEVNRINSKYNKYIKLESLYMDENGGVYFVTIYMNNGVMIWISRVGDKFPHYFFRMI